jgi:hypothetical protein
LLLLFLQKKQNLRKLLFPVSGLERENRSAAAVATGALAATLRRAEKVGASVQ